MRSGTQSIERAIRLLKAISARSRFGWRPSDLAAHCAIDRGTTHRILNRLMHEGLVRQRREDRHYVPGPLLFEMGLAMPDYARFQAACQPVLTRVARHVPGYALLCVRSGADSVCIATAGAPAYVGTAFDVGTRRPLAATSAGIAILLALPRERAVRMFEDQVEGGNIGLDPAVLRRMWRRSLATGLAVNQGFTARGVNAVATPVRDGRGEPFASLALAAAASVLTAARLPSIAELLAAEARTITRHAERALPDGIYGRDAAAS